MENALPITIIFVYGFSIIACVGMLIYFVFKRIEAQKNEEFEQRDN